MAILFHDGFDHYGAGNIANSLAQVGGFVASGYSIPTQTISLQESYARYTTARTGAPLSCGAMLPTSAVANAIWIQRAVPQTWATRLVFGFALRFSTTIPYEVQVLELNADLQITILPDLTVKVFGQPTLYKLEPNIYYFLEIQIDKAGKATLWVSNTQVATATGKNATVTAWHLMAKCASAYSNLVSVDDVYLLDGSGTQNTSRLGRTNSVIRVPTATVEAGFSVSSGSALNHTYVNKISPLGDSSYVKSNKAVRDLYSNNTPMLGTKPIFAVSVIVSARREDGDDFKVIPIVKSGSTVKDGAEYGLTQYNYTGISHVYETDPATNARWLAAGLLAANWGQRLKVPVITP